MFTVLVWLVMLYFYTLPLTGTPNLLVLIDQHAAHERVRLEALTAGETI